jgi:hypothetical protein
VGKRGSCGKIRAAKFGYNFLIYILFGDVYEKAAKQSKRLGLGLGTFVCVWFGERGLYKRYD